MSSQTNTKINDLQGKKILVIDDDPDLCRLVAGTFAKTGAQVFAAGDGYEGIRQFFEHRPDLVFIDIMMPKLDGWEVCRQIRQFAEIPLIFLTALGHENAVVRGLDCGAIDYVTKPFSPSVLRARAEAALRQATSSTAAEDPAVYSDGYLSIDLAAHRILVQGNPVKLTPTEYRLLAYLYKHAGRTLPFQQILQHVWGQAYQGSVEYVYVHLSNLRKKLEENPKQPRYLISEYGLGCRFEK